MEEKEIEILQNTIKGLKQAEENAVTCDSVTQEEYEQICNLIEGLNDRLTDLEIENKSIRLEAI